MSRLPQKLSSVLMKNPTERLSSQASNCSLSKILRRGKLKAELAYGDTSRWMGRNAEKGFNMSTNFTPLHGEQC